MHIVQRSSGRSENGFAKVTRRLWHFNELFDGLKFICFFGLFTGCATTTEFSAEERENINTVLFRVQDFAEFGCDPGTEQSEGKLSRTAYIDFSKDYEYMFDSRGSSESCPVFIYNLVSSHLSGLDSTIQYGVMAGITASDGKKEVRLGDQTTFSVTVNPESNTTNFNIITRKSKYIYMLIVAGVDESIETELVRVIREKLALLGDKTRL